MLFEHQTVAELAAAIEAVSLPRWAIRLRGDRAGGGPTEPVTLSPTAEATSS
jgi:hypothetical protein